MAAGGVAAQYSRQETTISKIKLKNRISVEISSADESKLIQSLTNLNEIPIKTTVNTAFSICKSLTYIYNYNFANFTELRRDS